MSSVKQKFYNLKIAKQVGRFNLPVVCSRNVIYYTIFIFASTSLLQAFLTDRGVSSFEIGLVITFQNAAQVVAYLFMGSSADRTKRPILSIALWSIISVIYPASMIIMCLMPWLSSNITFLVMITSYTLFGFIIAARYLFLLRTDMYLIDSRIFGRFMGFVSLITQIVAIFIGIWTVSIMNNNPGAPGYIKSCVLGIAVIIIATLIGLLIAPQNYKPNPSIPASPFKALFQLLKQPRFYRLLFVFAARGGYLGLNTILLTVGIYRVGLTSVHAPLLTTITTAGQIIGNFVYTVMAKRFKNESFFLIGAISAAFSYIAMIFVSEPIQFIVLSFFSFFGQSISETAALPATTETIPADQMGTYSSGRLVITLFFTSVAALLAGSLAESSAIIWFFVAVSIIIVAGSINAFIEYRSYRRADNEKK